MDIRGQGLMLGVELVSDRDTRKPAEHYAAAVTARCMELELNLNIVKFRCLGAVLRIAPPLTVSIDDVDIALEYVLAQIDRSGNSYANLRASSNVVGTWEIFRFPSA